MNKVQTIDPLIHCFWESLSPRARAVVESQASAIYSALLAYGSWGPLNCDLACRYWKAAFQRAGVPVRLISGNYDARPGAAEWIAAGGEMPLSSDHTWLRVDGAIFDPTASQFLDQGPIRLDAYFPSD